MELMQKISSIFSEELSRVGINRVIIQIIDTPVSYTHLWFGQTAPQASFPVPSSAIAPGTLCMK